MMEYLQTHFDEDIVAEPSWQWKKECESHENNVKSNFEKKEDWYIENSTEEFRRDTSEETLKTIHTTNQTSTDVNFVWQHRSEHYDNDRRQTQYHRTTTNFKSGRGNFFQQNPENNNTNYKPKKNKMNIKTLRNNSDARQQQKNYFSKYSLSEFTKHIYRINQSKQPTEKYGPDKHP